MELLASTCELPDRKRDLRIILGHHRHALHALATEALAAERRAIR